MKVYLTPPQPDRGLQRIANALTRYAPSGVEVVTEQPDLTIIYAIGRRDHIQRQVEAILESGGKYAIIQVCLRSTMNPSTWDWLKIWQGAEIVWSYYDLRRLHEEDGAGCGYWETQKQMDRWDDDDETDLFEGAFLHAPLGVDSQIFHPDPHTGPKRYTIATSGNNRLQESIRECALAAEQVDGQVFHLGRPRLWYANMDYSNGIPDDELAECLSACHFASGLRRTEGFELPAAEGLLCGSRPVVFDTADYRFCYREFADYVHEGTRQEVIDQLVQLFKRGPRPVGKHELEEARHWFNWERVCGEFWQRCSG